MEMLDLVISFKSSHADFGTRFERTSLPAAGRGNATNTFVLVGNGAMRPLHRLGAWQQVALYSLPPSSFVVSVYVLSETGLDLSRQGSQYSLLVLVSEHSSKRVIRKSTFLFLPPVVSFLFFLLLPRP